MKRVNRGRKERKKDKKKCVILCIKRYITRFYIYLKLTRKISRRELTSKINEGVDILLRPRYHPGEIPAPPFQELTRSWISPDGN